MTAAAGTVLLAAALVLSLSGALVWGRAAHAGGHPGAQRRGRIALLLTLVAVLGAVAVLEQALLRRDTDLGYVAKVTEPGLPVYYRITSLWSALEGSLLLWLLALIAVTVLATRSRPGLPPVVSATAATVLGLGVTAFTAVALVASPFTSSGAAAAAPPSPLLQDHPAMGIHPPLLYAGFAALAVPYALSIGGLVACTGGAAWARAVRGWTVAAWILLTAGILLGAWWSYAVLGWGGYWAWDPVENASLMPWLVATASLHTVGVRGAGRPERTWVAALAGGGFLLVLLATFLTRSGVVASIHAFSTSPLGPLLLGILLLALVPWAVLLLRRRDRSVAVPPQPLLSRGTALQLNRVLLVLVTAVVLVGSVLPAIVLASGGDQLSVGPPWYARTLAPLAGAVLLLMAVGPEVAPRGDTPADLLARLRGPLLAAAATAGVVGLLVPDVWLSVVSGLSAFVLAGLAARLVGRGGRDRRAIGALVAHLGVAVGAVAVLAGGHAATTQDTVPIGGTLAVQGTSLTLLGVDRSDDGRRIVAEARLLVAEGTQAQGTAQPQLRWYEAQNAMLTSPEITTEPFRDVYVTLLDVDPGAGTATLRLAVTPLMSWLWGAGVLTIAGAAGAGWPRRRSAPRRGDDAVAVPREPERQGA